jgi:hypothetical protein
LANKPVRRKLICSELLNIWSNLLKRANRNGPMSFSFEVAVDEEDVIELVSSIIPLSVAKFSIND